LRPNGCMDQDVTWYGGRPRPRRLCVRWGLRSSSPKGGEEPQFSAHVYCGQTAGWMKLVLGMVVGLRPGDFVLDGDPAPFPRRGRSPPAQFTAHFYCGQTAGCIKMPLGTDVGLIPGDFVLNGDTVPPSPKRGRSPQIFGPCLLWPNGWMDEACTWHGGRPQPRRHCVRWRPSPPPQKGGGAPKFLEHGTVVIGLFKFKF